MAVVAPAYNEAGKIGNVVRKVMELSRQTPEMSIASVVVDDGSSDGTASEAAAAGAVVLHNVKNSGVGAAIRTGMDWALDSGYDIVAVLGGDDQHDPQELPRMLDLLIRGECVFVQGSRWMNGGAVVNCPLFRRITTMIYPVIVRILTGKACSDGTNGYRAFTTDFIRDSRILYRQECLNGYELEPYLLYKALTLGFSVKETPITVRYHKEHGGCTKMQPILDWWHILRPLLYLRMGIWK